MAAETAALQLKAWRPSQRAQSISNAHGCSRKLFLSKMQILVRFFQNLIKKDKTFKLNNSPFFEGSPPPPPSFSFCCSCSVFGYYVLRKHMFQIISIRLFFLFFLLFWNKWVLEDHLEPLHFWPLQLGFLCWLLWLSNLSSFLCLAVIQIVFLLLFTILPIPFHFVFFDNWPFHALARHWLWVLSFNSAKEHKHKSKHKLKYEKLGQSPSPGNLALTRKINAT